jgi:hypothetical protein
VVRFYVRRKIIAALVFATMSMAMVGAPAFAHDAGPCTQTADPGHSEYAVHHIVFNAHDGTLGAGGHIPGTHKGFSICT